MKKLGLLFCLIFFPAVLNAALVPQEIVTPNGLKAWYLQDPDTQVVVIKFAFKGGARLDPKDKAGTANILAGMMSQSTLKKTPKEFSSYLQDYAMSLNFSTSIDFFEGTLTMLAKNKAQGISLLKEAFGFPPMTGKEFNKVKEQIFTNLENEVKNPSYIASTKIREMLFKGHPYARLVSGSPSSVEKITLEDVESYFKDNLSRDRLLIVVVGNISKEEAGKALDQVFSPLPKGTESLKEKEITPDIDGQYEFIELDIPQTKIHFLLPGIMYDNPNFLKLSLLVQILGGGFNSLLFKEIREQRGLAYTPFSYISWEQEAGYIGGYVGTVSPKAKESIRIVKEIVKKLAEKGITQKELNEAKSYMIGSYPLRFTSSSSIASMLLSFQEAKRPLDYFKTRDSEIRDISLSSMNNFIKEIIKPSKLAFVVVGEKSTD